MPNLALLNLLLQLVVVVIRTAIPCTSTCHALLIGVLRICLDYLFAIDKFIIISLDQPRPKEDMDGNNVAGDRRT